MSDTFQHELRHLYEKGRLDRVDILTSLFHAYFLFLESQGKHPSITDVRHLLFEILHEEGKVGEAKALFVAKDIDENGTVHRERGMIDTVRVHIFENGTGKITAYVDADERMKNAVQNACIAAIGLLNIMVDSALCFEMFDYGWSIGSSDDSSTTLSQNVRYQHESIGLSIALAAISAYVGRNIELSLALTGEVDRGGNVLKVNIGHKCLIEDDQVTVLVIPAANGCIHKKWNQYKKIAA